MVSHRFVTVISCALGLTLFTSAPTCRAQNLPQSQSLGTQPDSTLENKIRELLSKLPPPIRHFESATTAAADRFRAHENYQQLLREKLADRWFAALLDVRPTNTFAITTRLPSWKALIEFIHANDVIVDVWAFPEGATTTPRRIPATELAQLRIAPRAPPTFLTLTWRDSETQAIRTNRVEFAFNAAERALAAHRSYQRQREMQIAVREILSARAERGRLSAVAQWNALQEAVRAGRLDVYALPEPFTDASDLFVAVEYEVDEFNNVSRVLRFYHESEIQKRIVRGAEGRATQILVLKKRDWQETRKARGFRVRGLSNELEPAPSVIPGQDIVDLRVVNPHEPDPRKWNVLDFGEPAVLRDSALAKFSLINAHLERHRKEIGMKKANLDLIAEPLILGLNLGSGVVGLGVPAGDVGRLFYNLITPYFIADVPSVKQLRELFLILAAKESHSELKTKPAHFLSKEDIRELETAAQKLTPEQIQDYLERIDDHDLEAMLFIARMRKIDAQVTNFLNILTSAGKVSGVTESGILRDIFNSVYFSLNGDLNIKTILSVALGHPETTALSGVSLETLAQGKGPASAWLQFFEVSVDIRALINTLGRIPRRNFAEKELYKPLPYALKATDLAAYEVRIFGFPLFIFYKRGLIKDDMKAYDEDYAYGIDGPKIVEHFKTKEEMDAEIRSGRMWPLGYVQIPNGNGGWRDSNLAVFAHQLPSGKHQGHLVLIIYGLKAYADHSQYAERELQRFREYEKALEQGAVIEKLEDADNRHEIAGREFEPKLHLGTNTRDEIYAPLLGGLLELRRAAKQKAWGLPVDPRTDRDLAPNLTNLRAQAVSVSARDCLIDIDDDYSSFRFEKFVDGRRRVMKMTYIPSLEDLKRDLEKAEEGQRIEQRRRAGISTNGSGVILLNEPREIEGRREIGEPFDRAIRERPPEGAGVSSNESKLSLSARQTGGEGRGEVGLPSADAGGKRTPVLVTRPSLTRALDETLSHMRQSFVPGFVPQGAISGKAGHEHKLPLFASAAQSDSEPTFTSAQLLAASEDQDPDRASLPPRPKPATRTSPATFLSVDQFLDQLDHLPVVDRARLAYNHFASTLLEIDADGDGTKERVFVTVEFPIDRLITREHVNPLAGEREWLQYKNGLWLGTITPRRILEIEYDPNGLEVASRTWHNTGTPANPVKGALIEETRTLESWHRDFNQQHIDPYPPVTSKLRLNHITGQFTRETYGLFPLPVITVDEQFITETRFNPFGVFVSATVSENGRAEADFQRPAMDKLLNPVPGAQRYVLTSQVPPEALSQMTDLRVANFQTAVERRDLVQGISKLIVFDNANFGRRAHEEFVDSFDGSRSFKVFVAAEYRDDFFFGLIPISSRTESAPGGALLSKLATVAYDPVTRRLAANETDYTGKQTRKVWDTRWENPVEVESATRRTTNQYNRTETGVIGATFGKLSGEEIARFSGRFDPAARVWRLDNTIWWRVEITNRVETATLSAFGKPIVSHTASVFEARPNYDAEGRENSVRVLGRNSMNGRFDVLLRVEDEYRWPEPGDPPGRRGARVQTYVEGQPFDTFHCGRDSDGRIIADALKTLPGVDLTTVVVYDHDTERVLNSMTLQNGVLRVERTTQPEVRQADGTYHLPVRVSPYWGLAWTETYRIGDPLARPINSGFDNGETVQVTEWFQSTALPKTAERRDRSGRPEERWVTRLNGGSENGLVYDWIARSKVNPWGGAGLAEEKAVVRGTDITLFTSAGGKRTYFDLARPYDQPAFTVDAAGEGGLTVTLNSRPWPNVLAVFDGELQAATQPSRRNVEPILRLQSVDLRGLFFHKVSVQTFDRAGNLLEERIARIPNLGEQTYSRQNLRAALAQAKPTKKFRLRYERGWLIESPDPQTGGRQLEFTNRAPSADTRAIPVNEGQREFPTQIVGIKASAEELDAAEVASSFFRTSHSPRIREFNPYMPGRSDVWNCWTTTEFKPDRTKTFDSETIYDAQGRLSVSRATKATSSDGLGTKILYSLTDSGPGALKPRTISSAQNAVPLQVPNQRDYSVADFIYLFLERTNRFPLQLLVTDFSGNSVRVSDTLTRSGREQISFWPVQNTEVRWLPNASSPRHGTAVGVADGLATGQRALIVSVHDLARAGLDVRQIRSAVLEASVTNVSTIAISPIYLLTREGPFVADQEGTLFSFGTATHASRLNVFSKASQEQTETEALAGLHESFTLKFNGLPVGFGRMSEPDRSFPQIVFIDSSDADAPAPLYTLSRHDGRFVEHYKMPKWGDAQVYSIAHGFQIPKYEVFSSSRLADEASPGFVAYGYDYPVRLPLARGGGTVSRGIASVQNRIVANSYRLAGEELLRLLGATEDNERARSFEYSALHNASTQALAIAELPMLAQALLPARPLPWTNGLSAPAVPLTLDRRDLGLQLLRLHVTNFPTSPEPGTGLIPTSLDPQWVSYVETVKEAELIELAVALNETSVAHELLDFYWLKSLGGVQPLHTFYHRTSQAARAADPLLPRTPYARQSAEAQIAVAEAAFHFGLKSGDTNALLLGKNLVSLVLTQFWSGSSLPRGITQYRALTNWSFHGLTLWPDPEQYPIGCNARGYVLLKQLDTPGVRERVAEILKDPKWSATVSHARSEVETWLRNFVVPHVERTGVVPNGLFQIQDVHDRTSALAVERWSSTDAWLSFLAAADLMGLPKEQTRRWLENLARVHGLTLNGVWGLDWCLPLGREDLISPELTARFVRVAEALGHVDAAAFARQNLLAMQQAGAWPVVITRAPPIRPLPTGDGSWLFPDRQLGKWPDSFGVQKQLLRTTIAAAPATVLSDRSFGELQGPGRTDVAAFVSITSLFYLSILASAIFWWRFRRLRGKKEPEVAVEQIVPEAVMQRAEERWAKRVLGVQTPPGSENTRFSNAAVEQNFLMQLRAIYKLVLEWRRRENGWTENDARLANDEADDWLNGMDEFASIVGIYMRWVIKAGAKDGFDQADLFNENEDSNHIWSRLVMYFAEYYWGLLVLLDQHSNLVVDQDKAKLYGQISKLLTSMGARQRPKGFDARVLMNFPANPAALDLLIIQKPGMTLEKVLFETCMKLKIPYSHMAGFVEKYKAFKRREQPYPIHPYIIEMAKVLPHFGLMGLGALVWYNQRIGENPIVPYLWNLAKDFAFDTHLVLWVLPLLAGLVCTVLGYVARVYRFDAPMLPRVKPDLVLDATLTSLFAQKHDVMPNVRPGRKWNPVYYERAAWALRAFGFTALGITLLRLEAPSFATFLVVKGLLAMVALGEVAAIVLPLAATALSKWLQDRVTAQPRASQLTHFFNKLNITATRPASPLWLSIKYHTQPSVPSGGWWSTLQTILFYFILAALFALVGAFLCQEMFPLWFTEKYLTGADWKLFMGALFFWNTMYLLRYGLFLAFTGAASFVCTFPIKGTVAFLALTQLALMWVGDAIGKQLHAPASIAYTVAALGLVLMLFERSVIKWLKRTFPPSKGSAGHCPASPGDPPGELGASLVTSVASQQMAGSSFSFGESSNGAGESPVLPTLGVVYMSGDDLSHLKLSPGLLMSRWVILRDKLDSDGLRLLFALAGRPDDATLEQWFKNLYDAEQSAGATLWHPIQICIAGDVPAFRPTLGLTLTAENAEKREQLLTAWHLRRWLVTMMSTAGHAQDTAVTIVDIAARLEKEGLAAQTVFYLIQNKYDNNDNNRPVQTPYDQGELAQRNKLARLLKELAPGCRAYSIQNWTPFGFKAGGLTGMDLIHEEAMKLTTMLVLDRNANVHDLDALMTDLSTALHDPDVIIVIPGRGTTNTLTPLGQGSQMVEEGHRSFLKGLMGLLGGNASEMVGTGWGNILACYYGRTQRAMLDPHTPKMPLTSRMRRGSSFAVRVEGLIGFTPHAVGISEDTWAVSQTAHNAMALGGRVKFLLSRALWHKIRETWSHAEWLASFPRWSGGFLQMMHDPIMQRINDFGPASVFAKEIRANSGRNFLTAPFALLNIVLMPLAIMLDVTPFIEILVVLWNFGFVMNQILTVHGLNAYLEGSGFHRLTALAGAVLAGAASALVPGLMPFTPALLIGGFLAGGFIVGLGRWLYTRIRDIILFGPQLVLHALGQLVRQSLEFSVSGASPEDAKGVNMAFRAFAGPREDRPLDTFPTFINLKTIVWIVGLGSVVLNLFALSNLDMLNVLLLLPSLLFSVSLFVGPFLMTPKPGTRIGKRIVLAKLLAWLSTLALLTSASVLIGRGRWLAWMAVLLLGFALFLLLQRALRFSTFRQRLDRNKNRLVQLLVRAGLDAPTAAKLAQQLIGQATGDRAKLEVALTQANISHESQMAVIARLQSRIAPLLRAPVEALSKSPLARSRFFSAFARSFVLSMSILTWFFIVPVPGLFVFTARDYRISLNFSTILLTLGGLIGVAIASFWTARLIEWLQREHGGGKGLRRQIEQTYRSFRAALRKPGALLPAEISRTNGLLTDAQTYLDQRSYSHAFAALKKVDESLPRPSLKDDS